MRPKNTRKPLHSETPKVRRPPGAPTKSQLRALANAEAQARVAKWKTLLSVAGAHWSKLDPIEISRSQGEINVLAGLVQLRYRVSRQEADSQVKAFLDQHLPTKVIVAPTPILVRPVIAPEAVAALSESTVAAS